jgi:hypothetical protein
MLQLLSARHCAKSSLRFPYEGTLAGGWHLGIRYAREADFDGVAVSSVAMIGAALVSLLPRKLLSSETASEHIGLLQNLTKLVFPDKLRI